MGAKFFIINLESSIERRESATERFTKLGLDFEFFPATDGRNLSEAELKLYDSKDENVLTLQGDKKLIIEDKLSLPELGCAFSHLRLYQHILDKGLDYAFILEDDFVPAPIFQDMVQLVENFPEDFDLINFSNDWGIKNSPFAKKYYFGSGKEHFFVRLGMGSDALNVRFNARRFCIGAFCYAVSRKACQRLIELGYPVRIPADYLTGLLAFHKLKMFADGSQLSCYPQENRTIRSTIEVSASDRPQHRMRRA